MNTHHVLIQPPRPALSARGASATGLGTFPATICALICLAFTLAIAGCSKPVDLKAKMIVGKKLVLSTTTVQTTETTREGATNANPLVNTKFESTQYVEWLVSILSESEGGGRELELELSAAQTSSKAGDRTTVTFDSLADQWNVATNVPAQVYRRLIGAKLAVGTDAAFTVTKSPPVAEFIPVIPASAPTTPSAALQRVLATNQALANSFAQSRNAGQRLAGNLVTNLLSQNSLNEIVATTIRGLPSKPVRPGDSWSARQESKDPSGSPAMVTTELKYTFKKWEMNGGHNCALFEFTGTTTLPDINSLLGGAASSSPAMQEMLSKMNMKMEAGEMRGKAWFDPELGMFREVVTEQAITQSMSMPGIQGAPAMNTKTVNQVKTSMKVAEAVGSAPR